MQSNHDFLLKVSLHGMSHRMQDMMNAYLKLLCKEIAIVSDDEAQTEIIDIDSSEGNRILNMRLSNKPHKPIIVISLNEVSSDQFIYVKKPLNVNEFSLALLTVKNNIRSKQVQNLSEKTKNGNRSSKMTIAKLKKLSVSNISNIRKEGKQGENAHSASSRQEKDKIAEEATKLLNQMAAVDNLLDMSDDVSDNQRKTIRYAFHGIEFSLKINSLTGRRILLPINVIDISSKGAMIQCDKQLRLRTKVVLKFYFSPKKSFNLRARVIRRKDKNCYGLIFEKHYHKLIDFLITIANSYNIVE